MPKKKELVYWQPKMKVEESLIKKVMRIKADRGKGARLGDVVKDLILSGLENLK
jgi:hypothetical protein